MRLTASATSSGRVWLERVLVYSPALLALVLMLPRLASAQFGMLDDGETALMARQVTSGDWLAAWEGDSGRSRPVYWLFYWAIHTMAGPEPFWFFFANTLMLISCTLALIYVANSLGGSRLQSATAGLMFVLSGPIVEDFYTLSKQEPLQLTFLLASLVFLVRLCRPMRRGARYAGFMLVLVWLTLANLTKETSLVMMPVAIGWALLLSWRGNRSPDRAVARALVGYALVSGIGTLVFLALRAHFAVTGLPGNNYVGNYVLTPSRLIESSVRYIGWLTRDFAFVAPLAVFWFFWSVKSKQIPDTLFVGVLVWTVFWIGIYLPWRNTRDYYLLAFTAGLAILIAQFLEYAFRQARQGTKLWRGAAFVSLAMALPLFLASLASNISNARIQLAIDAANSEMLEVLAAELPRSSLVLVNIQAFSEYVEETQSHLSLFYDRPDLLVEQFEFQPQLESEGDRPLYVVSPMAENQPVLRVRMGFLGADAALWNASMIQHLRGAGKEIHRIERAFPLFMVDLPRLLCPLMPQKEYCQVPGPLIDRRLFSYGWVVYEVRGQASRPHPGHGASQCASVVKTPSAARIIEARMRGGGR